MFCSTIIPTVGRDSLARAVQSVLMQSFSRESIEVIIVNDSPRPLTSLSYHHDDRVRIIQTQQRERCVARNAGAAIAYGDYLHFLDDDDWLQPDAIDIFFELAARAPKADWLLAGTQLVDRQQNPLIQMRHLFEGNVFVNTMAGEWLPLQASLLKKEAFWRVGGFNPLIPGGEDIDLARRMTLQGNVAISDKIVATVEMGTAGSTTDRERGLMLARIAREDILAEPRAFERMATAAADGYWHGRIMRAYLTSMVWNLKHRRPIIAAGRLSMGLRSVLHAPSSVLTGQYWQAVSRPYQSQTFKRGAADAG